MATPQRRRAARAGTNLTRRVANRHKKKVSIKGNAIIKAHWNVKQTVRQNYERLGLLSSLNGTAGGSEKVIPSKSTESDTDSDSEDERPVADVKELTEEDIENIKKTLRPGEGVIQRDNQGNVIQVIVGDQTHDDILDAEPEPVAAKTDVVRKLEEQAASKVSRKRYMSEYEKQWISKLIEKHGDNYDAMFRDSDLNQYQQTAAQLKQKCQQFLRT